MTNKTINEMSDYLMLQEMRALKDKSTITYDEFLKIMGWSGTSHKNQLTSNASINHLRK